MFLIGRDLVEHEHGVNVGENIVFLLGEIGKGPFQERFDNFRHGHVWVWQEMYLCPGFAKQEFEFCRTHLDEKF